MSAVLDVFHFVGVVLPVGVPFVFFVGVFVVAVSFVVDCHLVFLVVALSLMSPIIVYYRQKSTPIIRNSRILSKFFQLVVSLYHIKVYVERPTPINVNPYHITTYVYPPYTPLRGSDYLIHPLYHPPI